MSGAPAASGGAAALVAERLRRGDLAGARTAGEAALVAEPGNAALLQLVGVACCRTGEIAAGAVHLDRAFALAPDLPRLRPDLANARAMLGDRAGALALCPPDAPAELQRLRGYLLQEAGDAEGAAAAYARVLTADPRDWEIWNNLGNARRALGDLAGAADALGRAVALQPRATAAQTNLATALAALDRDAEAIAAAEAAVRLEPGNAAAALMLGGMLRHAGRADEALPVLERAAQLAPDDPAAWIEVGRVRWRVRDEPGAEAAYRSGLRLRPDDAAGWLELGIIFERSGRMDALPPLLAEAAAAGAPLDGLGYLRALVLRGEGRLEEALEAARAAPAGLEPERRAALIGRLADALGRADDAFAAFAEMNRASAATPAARVSDAAGYRARIAAMQETASPDWFARWRPGPPPGPRPAPVFLVGFPRSGTTLLDTFLMGHPHVHVLEEEPVLQRAQDALGDFARLPGLDDAEIERLRAVYFAALDAVAPEAGAKTVVDKLPLNILGAPLIHRLFPDARIVLSLRHPCDAVLSGFMQAFEPNDAMANFLALDDAAALYDLVFAFWEKCRAGLPLAVHTLRYEALIAQPETEMRALIGFLGLDWDERLLDHRRTAAARGTIVTPSYGQVTQPLYARAAGRWERYRAQLRDVLPILCPWAERHGYGPCG
ncbi:MAG: sulfotransferase [Alphaproteobacteria bacterium]|nr:sulfotransferase [Alphaproteobacteria bacterium]